MRTAALRVQVFIQLRSLRSTKFLPCEFAPFVFRLCRGGAASLGASRIKLFTAEELS